MDKLTSVINYLQHNDQNGTYEDIIKEIEQGLLTITEAKKECIDILIQWQSENLAPNDIKGYNRIQKLIDSITK